MVLDLTLEELTLLKQLILQDAKQLEDPSITDSSLPVIDLLLVKFQDALDEALPETNYQGH